MMRIETGAVIVENSMEVSQKTKNRNTIWPIAQKKNASSKRYMDPSVQSSIIYNCQDMETISVHQMMDA